MKKVYSTLLIATMLFSMGVTYDASAKEIAKVEVSKIEKSCVAPTGDESLMLSVNGLYQDDVYFIEETCYGNYILPTFEAVYIEVLETPPNSTQNFSTNI